MVPIYQYPEVHATNRRGFVPMEGVHYSGELEYSVAPQNLAKGVTICENCDIVMRESIGCSAFISRLLVFCASLGVWVYRNRDGIEGTNMGI